MTTELLETEPETPEVFVLDSEEKVNWLLCKLATLEAERLRVQAQAAQRVKEIEADLASLRYRFEADLKAFAAQQIEKNGGRRKSVTLLQGTLAFRSVPASLKVADEEAALTHAREAGIELRVSLDKTVYRTEAERHLRETGELLPGIETVAAHEAFSIRFGKSE